MGYIAKNHQTYFYQPKKHSQGYFHPQNTEAHGLPWADFGY